MNLETGDGIKRQLGNLTSEQWAWVVSIFYYPYMVAEPFSTLALKRFKPHVWMTRIMLIWGAISMCQAATQNYAGILACRFFLGLAEAGFYPGVLYHLSFLFPADRIAFRIAIFYASGQFSGTISGLLAYGLSYINGVGGLAGWRWLFILEGIPAILCAAYTFFRLPDYPETSNFLSQEEKEAILQSLPKSQPTSKAKTWNPDQVKVLVRDPTFVGFAFCWFFHATGGWGITTMLPNVVYELGLVGTANAQLMTMPAYAFGCSSLVLIGWLIHRNKINAWATAIALESFTCVCYIILITVRVPVVRYIFVTLALSCSVCIYPILWPKRIEAANGTTAAGLAIGITNAVAQFSGVLGPQIYQTKFGPTYKTSFAIAIGLLVGANTAISFTWILVRRKSRKITEESELSEHEVVVQASSKV